jgi:DNA-binding transcriptional ArsR family regulator
MTFSLIEDRGDVKVSYDSILVHPKKMNIFNSDLSLKIINELVKEPGCAMDLARRLGQHEQKIYYHIRKMEDAGVIRMSNIEKRYGMNAKIYSVVSPVISTKIYDDGHEVEKKIQENPHIGDPDVQEFLMPFVKDGKLNAKIIVGDPNEHGRFDLRSKEGSYVHDFSLMLGSIASSMEFPCFIMDTEVRESDLKNNNLILIGNMRTNTIVDGIKEHLPIEFRSEGHFSFYSKKSRTAHMDPRTGYVIKTKNPFNHGKMIMVIGGIRTRGTRAAVVALTQSLKKLIEKNDSKNGDFLRIVKGLDKGGRGIVDSFEVLE